MEQEKQEEKVQMCNIFGTLIKDINEKGDSNG